MGPQVLVVGAGPTGLLLTAELHRRGVDCQLIDALEEQRHWDRATVVHPRSLEVFESLGIVERFLDAGVRQRAVRLHSDGEVLGEMDLTTCGSAYGFNLGLSEEVTESILTDHLHGQGGSVTRSCRLVGLDPHPAGVTATIEHEGELHDVSAQWVVGCDGFHSPTRQLSGIGFEGHDIAEPWAVFDATLDRWPGEFDVTFAYLEATPVILTALPDRRWRIYLRPSSPTVDLVEDAAAVIDRYQPGVSPVDVENPSRFHCHTKVAERYQSGRVLLAGDAAHVCSPAQGHGMNSGLQDAVNLAWKLALVCHDVATPGLLGSYEAERRPVAVAITRSGDMAEDAESLTEPADRTVRDQMMQAAFADPASRHHEVVLEAELDISYAGSPVVDGDHNPHLAPGDRLPNTGPVQARGANPCHLHQLTHHAGHTLLVLGGRAGHGERLAAQFDALREDAAASTVFDAAIALSTDLHAPAPIGHLAPSVAQRLGIEDVTILAVRPDGHVGLRLDRADVAAVQRYLTLIHAKAP